MTALVPFMPLLAAAAFGHLFYRINRTRGWFTIGELIFWVLIVLVVFQLIWLKWF